MRQSWLWVFLFLFISLAIEAAPEGAPPYLYKIVNRCQWESIRYYSKGYLVKESPKSVHLYNQRRVNRLLQLYCCSEQHLVVLELDTSLMPNLNQVIKEADTPYNSQTYYLYEGLVTRDMVHRAYEVAEFLEERSL